MADLPLPDAETRGHLDVRLAAVARIVEHVVATTDGTVARTSALGSAIGRVAHRNLPRVDVRVLGHGVRVRADVGCVWPTPVGSVGEQVRAAVVAETERLTGLPVRTVDVVVHVVPGDAVGDTPARAAGGRVA